MTITRSVALAALAFAGGVALGQQHTLSAQAAAHIYEIRTYTAAEGKLPAVLKRFRDHELPIFERNGMHAVLYSVAAEPPLSQNTFIYILEHASRESARTGWAGFAKDPEFAVARAESDQGGRAVVKVESVFVNPTDFSPMK